MDWIRYYLNVKADQSRKALASSTLPRKPLPWFASAEAVSDWMAKYLVYTGNGPRISWNAALGKYIGIGFPDLFQHPEILCAAAYNGTSEQIDNDCDGWATFAVAALRDIAGRQDQELPIIGIELHTLVAGSVQWTPTFPFLYWPCHTVTTFWRQDGQTKAWRCGLIETGGLHWADDRATVLADLGRRNGVTYIDYPTPYPFD